MKKNLVAVVLAGGEGMRFWPLSTNKILFPFFGKPLIEYSIIDALPKEVSHVVVVTSKNNNDAISKLSFRFPHTTVVQLEPRGMADALLTVAHLVKDASLLILIGDDISDTTLFSSVLQKAQRENAFGVLPGWKSEKYFPGGYLVIDGEKVVSVKEKPGAGNEPSPYVNISGHFIRDAEVLFAKLKETKSASDDIYEKALSSLMQENTFAVQPYEGGFASLKYPWHVLSVMDELFKRLPLHKGKDVDIRSQVTIEGDVYIEDGVKIFENSKIVGPAYIGKNTIIGNNSVIRNSHIGSNCVVGFSTEITRSYVGDDCWFHTNYIGDSVLERNVSMGAGAVLANVRLDEGITTSYVKGEKITTHRSKLGAIIGQDVRIGVNASIMPGVKIGRGSFVGSGVVLDKDLADESFSMVTQRYSVTRNVKRLSLQARAEFRKKI